ncbi:MAG: hypothetical protein IPM29_30515 [Planctomycetes bacterium]|nr:hypothetical protein [Planctomycetota bacterium]
MAAEPGARRSIGAAALLLLAAGLAAQGPGTEPAELAPLRAQLAAAPADRDAAAALLDRIEALGARASGLVPDLLHWQSLRVPPPVPGPDDDARAGLRRVLAIAIALTPAEPDARLRTALGVARLADGDDRHDPEAIGSALVALGQDAALDAIDRLELGGATLVPVSKRWPEAVWSRYLDTDGRPRIAFFRAMRDGGVPPRTWAPDVCRWLFCDDRRIVLAAGRALGGTAEATGIDAAVRQLVDAADACETAAERLRLLQRLRALRHLGPAGAAAAPRLAALIRAVPALHTDAELAEALASLGDAGLEAFGAERLGEVLDDAAQGAALIAAIRSPLEQGSRPAGRVALRLGLTSPLVEETLRNHAGLEDVDTHSWALLALARFEHLDAATEAALLRVRTALSARARAAWCRCLGRCSGAASLTRLREVATDASAPSSVRDAAVEALAARGAR